MKFHFQYILLLWLVPFFACPEGIKKKYVHQFNRTKKLRRKHQFYYSDFNLIVTPQNRIFFHQKDSILNCCDTGENLNYPDYIGLTPNDLIYFDTDDLIKKVQLSSNQRRDDKHSIQIALYSDTISDMKFERILFLMDSLTFSNFDVRLITEEERIVVEHKESNLPYDFYKIEWKSRFSNTGFSPPPPPGNTE